ncbi:three-Cys-motif partner protein [Nonomuraea maritima]|uniref:Three-Cys-motif partner protein n=1 Tax=Nonomuraea maritima TaxID=683260 RepID=A0A1G9RKA6_9ACTN|nr:three-Cys-motif partner protein [Nonomuraea maritima]
MSKDSDLSKWDCPPHTKAKHQMLSRYLDGWFPILSRWNGRILFLDGFAGRGRYNDGSEGSPLIALRRLIQHRHFENMRDREFVFLFIEADADNAVNLQKEIDLLKAEYAPWPHNIKTHVQNDRFDKSAESIINTLREQKRNLAPTFAFVDPFGYSGLPMDLLTDLLAHPCTEVFVNFMVGHVQRFITRDGQERAMRSLFGMDVRDVLNGYSVDADRVEHLREVYVRQLREQVGFNFVQSFAMANSTGNIGYYLFHGTRHQLGVKLMKDAMWKVDPGAGCRFSDRLAGQDVLFTPEPDLRPLSEAILQHFAGTRSVPVSEIEWYAILETPYRETHVRPVLRPLEKHSAIKVNRPPGKRQFADGVTIDFP